MNKCSQRLGPVHSDYEPRTAKREVGRSLRMRRSTVSFLALTGGRLSERSEVGSREGVTSYYIKATIYYVNRPLQLVWTCLSTFLHDITTFIL